MRQRSFGRPTSPRPAGPFGQSLGVLAVALLVACHRESPPRQGATASPSAETDTAGEPPAGELVTARPVVLELFTSQGCSSCPPADRLLSSIGERREVIALAFHVDYWNDLGWRDPFSSAEASERQRRYGEAIAGGRVYTPMLVIDGREHVVGSIPGAVSDAVDRARARGPGRWSIAITSAAIADAGDRRRVTGEIALAGGGGEVALWAAVRESGLRTEVSRGENAGEHLANDFVVRALVPLPSRPRQTIDISAPRPRNDSDAGRPSLVVIAQDRATLAIQAAAVADL